MGGAIGDGERLSAWPVRVALRLVGGREATLKFRVLVSLASILAVGAIGTGVAGASTQTEYFTATQTSVDGPQTVVAAGPISATGTDVQTGLHRDQFVFPAGVLTIRHEPVTRTQSYDSRTCLSRFTETGTYVIAKGTGAYVHVTGSGRYKLVGMFQGCDQSQPPTAVSFVIQAHGPLAL
ncbi:MAG TPA: hypothetical protein VIK61_05540 [Acidimicrobiia bacterium]